MAISIAEALAVLLAVPKVTSARHMDRMAYRAGNRIFATFRESDGSLNIMVPLDVQEMLCEAEGSVFAPVAGGWGPKGWTGIDLAAATAADLESALGYAVKESLVNKRAKRR
jgi:hypothetical protein